MPHGVITGLHASAFTIPTDLHEADGTAAWNSTTITVVTAESDGVRGTGWTYGPSACATVVEELLADVVLGRDPLAVPGTWYAMVEAVRNATRAGVAGYAISAVDVALWDLKARLLNLSLVDLFGAMREQVPVYGSGGFTTYSEGQLASQLTGWVETHQIPRVKIKIGEGWGHNEQRDQRRVLQAREIIGPAAALYVDINGAYSAKQAVRVLQGVAEANVTWVEEPVSSDDLAGLRMVRHELPADVTAGEYGTGLTYYRRMCAADALDCLQVDATRCGGYTEWLRTAAVAAAYELEVSAHCAPHLHAAVAAATPHLRHLEWFHDHVRIEAMLFAGALDPSGGTVSPAGPGHGLTFLPEAAEPYQAERGQQR